MAKFNVGDVVEYKSTNEGLHGVADDGDWLVIRTSGEKYGNTYIYGIYHPDNTGNYYPEYTLTKVDVNWRDLPVKGLHERYSKNEPTRFLREFQADALEKEGV